MKKSYALLSVFLLAAFFSLPPRCQAEPQDIPAVAPTPEQTSTLDSPFRTDMETPVVKIEEHPISESGSRLESEPVRLEFVQSHALPVLAPPVLATPVLKIKPKGRANTCKDQCNQPLDACHWSAADPSRGQLCNDEFMRCLRKCFGGKK